MAISKPAANDSYDTDLENILSTKFLVTMDGCGLSNKKCHKHFNALKYKTSLKIWILNSYELLHFHQMGPTIVYVTSLLRTTKTDL